MKVSGFSTLNTVVPPSRLGPDKYGVIPLTEAVNVDIGLGGEVSRRRGFAQKRSEPSENLWCDGGPCLFTASRSLYQLNDDFTRKGLRSGLTPARMSFCQVGDTAFYANGFENGYVKDGASRAWTAQSYVGAPTDRTFDSPPVGHLLAFYASSVWIARDNEVFRSEPFAFSWFDLLSGRIREATRIRLLAPVKDGLYIGDESGIWFYAQGVERTRVADYPAIEGAVSYCDASEISDKMMGRSAVVTTTEGLCLAAPSGTFINLTRDTLALPKRISGSSAIFKHRLLTLLHE